MVALSSRASHASWEAHTLCLHSHSASTHPPGWLCTNGLMMTRLLLFLSRQSTLGSACPGDGAARAHIHCLPFSIPVAKLSASIGVKWYPARRHTPFETWSLLPAKDRSLEKRLQTLLRSREFALTCVFSLNCHRARRLRNHLSRAQVDARAVCGRD